MTASLWVHVAAGSWWVLASIISVLAGAVAGSESVEGRAFISRVVPTFNRFNAAAAAVLLGSGVVNVFGAGERKHFVFSTGFTRMLELKVVLYIGMVAALVVLFGIERDARAGGSERIMADSTRRLVWLSGLIALAGAGAMLLGVWLAGE